MRRGCLAVILLLGQLLRVVRRTLTEHRNGTTWSEVASPSPGAATNALFGVSALTPTDAWAVSESLATRPGVLRTVVLRWNGKDWTRVPSPNPNSSGVNNLAGVSTVSPDHCLRGRVQ